MRKVNATVRRSTAILAVAIGMLAVTGSANAAGTGLPVSLSGKADSQALRVRLTLPSVNGLKATLAELGVPTSSLPSDGTSITLDEKISVLYGEVLHNIKGVPNRSGGFATAITGVLPVAGDLTRSVSSSCSTSGCVKGDSVELIDTDLPAGLGHVKIAGAESVTKSLLSTTNNSGLAEANISLGSLIAPGQQLSAVGDALRQLTTTINTTVLPPVNGALSTLEKSIASTLEDNAPEIKAELDKLITLGTINDLPDLSKVALANLTVLAGKADVFTKSVNGVKGLQALASSKVTDVEILGGWASIKAVGIDADSYANGVKGAASSTADSQVVGLNLGGLLGVDIDNADIDAIANPKKLQEAIRAAAAKNGLDKNKAEDLINSIELVRNIAGIQPTFFGTSRNVDPKGMFANAAAGTLSLVVEPQIPVLDSMFTLPGQTVPQFAKYVKTGVRLQIDLPEANSAVSIASNVLDRRFPTPRSRTGVGTPFLAAFGLIGLALVVRKFGMAK